MTDSLGPLRKPSQRRTILAAILAAGSLGLAACGTGAGAESETAETSDGGNRPLSGTIQSGTLGGTGVVAVGKTDVARKTARPDTPAQLMVESVEVASHEGFDRVVFHLFGSGEPGWFIDYTSDPAQQGSGNPIAFEGAVALNVNIDGTTYPFELNREDPHIGTVAGAGRVTQVISAGTFEGHSQFVIGVKEKLPYSVEVLQEPHRLVIDVLHS
ncbi:AMIN-like domain-containing (lipo)protein [Corynebacterium comes]|nr:hypothetical protein [Corynebacterium comes]